MALFLKILCDISKQAKFIEAGPIAGWLWLAGVGHCRLSSTDGFIHKDVVPGLVPRLKSPYTHAAMLVAVGLWEDAVGGYQVHDYLDMNPSKAELAEIKRMETERKRAYRDTNGAADLSQRARTSQDNETLTRARRGRASSPSPSGSGVEVGSAEDSEEISTAVAPVFGFGRKGAGGRFDALVTTHPNCDPATFEACHRGICVKPWDVKLWRQQLDPDRTLPDVAANHIRAFVRDVLATLPSGPIGDNPKDFWPKQWQAKHGTSAPSGSGKGNDSRDAMQRAIQRRQGGAA